METTYWVCAKHEVAGRGAYDCIDCRMEPFPSTEEIITILAEEEEAVKTAQRKRDRFELAKAAMQGVCGNQNYNPESQQHFDNVSDDAIRQADSMLAKLEEKS